MMPERPDLSHVDTVVLAYVEALEAEVARLRAAQEAAGDSGAADTSDTAAPESPEAPGTLNLITISARGLAKRTARHLYERQRRGGMGIFDIELLEDDAPALLAISEEAQALVLITSRARAFRISATGIPQTPVRGRGASLAARLPLADGETLAAALSERRSGGLALLSRDGYVRVLPAHVAGGNTVPGTALYRFDEFGPLVSASWMSGDDDVFVATRRGMAIRFATRSLPLAGGPGIRLEHGDDAVAIAAVRPDGGVFVLGADGTGTIRLMSGFSPNKAPGSGGKVAMKTDRLVAACAVAKGDDIFLISRLSKIIRFRAAEVPAKEGVVQGVHCMALRADEAVGAVAAGVVS